MDTDRPPPPSRRDHRSPAASDHALLTAVDAWCTRTLHRPRPLPHLGDDIDDIAVERACHGDLTITLNRAELEAAWRKLERRRLPAREIARILGVTPRTVVRWRQGYTRPICRRTIGALAHARGLAA